jgi:hypothetical protein
MLEESEENFRIFAYGDYVPRGRGAFIRSGMQCGAVIKGPGTIANFIGGVSAGGGFGDVLIYDLTLKGNQVGIGIEARMP